MVELEVLVPQVPAPGEAQVVDVAAGAGLEHGQEVEEVVDVDAAVGHAGARAVVEVGGEVSEDIRGARRSASMTPKFLRRAFGTCGGTPTGHRGHLLCRGFIARLRGDQLARPTGRSPWCHAPPRSN